MRGVSGLLRQRRARRGRRSTGHGRDRGEAGLCVVSRPRDLPARLAAGGECEALPIDRRPALERWVGTWSAGVIRRISIDADASTRQLTVRAHAEWYGGEMANGEHVVHTGDVAGKSAARGKPAGHPRWHRSRRLRSGAQLVGEFIGAVDNMDCGGMNVGFSDAYTRDSGARNDRK